MHDALQYFDKTFGTQCVGELMTSNHHVMLSGKFLYEIKKRIQEHDVSVLFSESSLTKYPDLGIAVAPIDYLGINIMTNCYAFEAIIEQLVTTMLKELDR